MKKISCAAFAIIMASLLTIGCQKVTPRSEHPFTIETNKVRANGVCVDIIPEYNDFRYMYTVLPKEYVDSFTGKEEELILLVDQTLKDTYAITTGDVELNEFAVKTLYNGAYLEYCYYLEPDSWYSVIAFAYTDITADRTLTKVDFQTPSQKPSDIDFTVRMNGSAITVIPSNGDNYFYTAYRKEQVEGQYSDPFEFHEAIDRYYWEEGFFPSILFSGDTGCDLTDFYELNVGERFYVTASGYDNGINSDIKAFLITYNGSDRSGTVIPIEKEPQ